MSFSGGGFPGSMSGKPGSGRGQDSILGPWVWVILVGICYPGSGSGFGMGLAREEVPGLGWSRVGVVGRDRELGGQLVKGVLWR